MDSIYLTYLLITSKLQVSLRSESFLMKEWVDFYTIREEKLKEKNLYGSDQANGKFDFFKVFSNFITTCS